MRKILTLLLALLIGTANAAIFNNDFTTNSFHVGPGASPSAIFVVNGVPIAITSGSTNAFYMKRGNSFDLISAGTNNSFIGGGPLTPNTIPKATGTNSIGDSSITDDGTNIVSSSVKLFLGPTNVESVIVIQPITNSIGNGSSLEIRSGFTTDTNGFGPGYISIGAADAPLGSGGSGGGISINSGQGDGGGSGGNFTLIAYGAMNLTSPLYTLFNTPSILAFPDNSRELGTASFQWSNIYAGTAIILQGNNVAALSQNGTNGAPVVNITNSATITWARSGSNWTATATTTPGDTTGTNIVTLTQTGTNISQLDFSLVARGGAFKLALTNNAYIGAPANVVNTSFKECSLMVQQPSTGTCALTFSNGMWAFPEGVAPVIDTNNGAVTIYEFKTDVFTNGLVHGWMSVKSKLVP